MRSIFGLPGEQTPTIPAPEDEDPEIQGVLDSIVPMVQPVGIQDETSTSIVISEEDLLEGDLPELEKPDPAVTGVAITGRQNGLFTAFDAGAREVPEITPSAGKSLDDLEREAIMDGLTKLGFRIQANVKFTQEDWRDLRQLLLEQRWPENPHRLVQVIHLVLSISQHAAEERLSLSSQERRNPKFLAGKLLERLRDMNLRPIMETLALESPNFPEKLPPKPPPLPKKP